MKTAVKGEGIEVSVTVVDQLLEKYNYRKRKAQKRLITGEHRQRNEKFENIEQLKVSYQQAGNPVLSMDTKKITNRTVVSRRTDVYYRRNSGLRQDLEIFGCWSCIHATKPSSNSFRTPPSHYSNLS
ncbi:hypothetical protein NIES4075_72420 [Tolypothrix sp. NIES-4075]|uniref:ISAzo13-like element transposase-related protein n=1 Tax=Tolypothrix sp. NIES-4075 TaxID=2005459 RepID=UPI000B716372|nr:hypothetical protein [Tolypothrix sp. NIES-4075]GAX46221.1 hypothetical protein NIES4075_72420 [Tolypothrix sp. NIES-4075]